LEDFEFNNGVKGENWFEIPESITLDHYENHLKFEYFAVDYLNPAGVEYTYFLEGFDKKWSPPTKSRYAVYNHIPPGNYVFKVKQAGNDFSQVATIGVYIKKPPPPFYKSAWFLSILLIFLALLVYYFTEYRTRKLRNQQLFLESKIEERTLEILESEREKTVLLQEVHHRVKNNLQIIISLFRLQSHFTDNEEALDLFRNSQNRIRSMSKIHEKLYETKDLSKIEIKSYLIELVEDLVTSYDINNEVKIKHDIQNCNITLDELTPLALIINEIITNSLKYGLKEVAVPTIDIKLRQNEVGFTHLVIADNGPGFDQDIWDNHQSMGVELIKTLTEQLDGEINLSFNEGHPIYELKFKAKM
jgi:two-component sensor histidine kinase